ncbi:hypothetical protein HPB50_027082 [Hyalomma asiaticum]|uniref:Uncharacterized protein n=1 Tax=Hyalomma asiaticum TaxID=266040 RepID=A0ACB7S0D6_HYAAI|nr:hypothetical protein HPB50_027082 [Hyalomma asiaticum]
MSGNPDREGSSKSPLPTGNKGSVRPLSSYWFSRAPESIEEDIGAEFSGCDELYNEMSKAPGVSNTEDGEIAFEEYVLYAADVPVTGMLLEADIIEMAVGDKDDYADEEEPREVEASGGDQRLMRCVEQLENAFLGPNANAKQASITQFFDPR